MLRLEPPGSESRLVIATLVSIPLLLGLAAAGPALRSQTRRQVRTDAQAMFVFDISRSMLASASRAAPIRLDQAKAVAIKLRVNWIPQVPSGVATFTTLLLPRLFPTPDEAVFDSTVDQTVGIEQPLPPYLAPGFPGTSFSALAPLRDQGYFSPAIKKRVVILLTDGESGPYDPQNLGQDFASSDYTDPDAGDAPTGGRQARLSLVIVRFGALGDRIYHSNGSVEVAYRPDPHAPEMAAALASATDGHVFTGSQTAAAGREIRQLLGSGPSTTIGVETTTRSLRAYPVIGALAALVLLIWRRNFVSI